MLVVLSHYTNDEHELEARIANARAELFVQPAPKASADPLPTDIRSRADAIAHYDSNVDVDGRPDDYPRCRIVVKCGVGFDRIDIAGWGRLGVAVCNVPDYGTSEVADHAIALLLALARGTATYHDALRRDPSRAWDHAIAPAVRRLRGATFGIIGLGRIGLATAMRARGFGMHIAFYDPYVPAGVEIAVDAQRCKTVRDLMAMSDVVSLHTPSTAATRGLINGETLASAKHGMILINTARGPIVDLDALQAAMKSGQVAAAGLDVLPVEPADPSHPLIAAWMAREPWLDGRLTLSPHAAFYSPDGMVDLRTKCVETAIAYLETGSLINCVNRDLLDEGRRIARLPRQI